MSILSTHDAPVKSVPQPRWTWLASAVLGIAALLLWWPAIETPFWGDDYYFLQAAYQAHTAGTSWLSALLPQTPEKFWRPLGEHTWWRLMLVTTGADAKQIHLANLALLALASSSVGVLAWVMARMSQWPQAVGTGVLAATIYGSWALHLLPVHWAAAANNSMLVLFTALALAAWVPLLHDRLLVRTRAALWAAVLVCFCAALLSKESAALTPVLMLCLHGFVRAGACASGSRRLPTDAIALWLVSIAVLALWVWLRHHYTSQMDENYALRLGSNVLKNSVAMLAWLLNVPREALRMLATGQLALGAGWAAIVAVPVLVLWLLAIRRARCNVSWRQWTCMGLFVLIAYSPYLLLTWNSYAYYAAVAAVLPTIVLARCLAGRPLAVLGAALLVLSSTLAVHGSRQLDHPGVIGRAYWAEATLEQIKHSHQQQAMTAPVWVQAADAQRFYAIGASGLQWRLGLPSGSVHVVQQCPADAKHCLVIDADGQWHRRDLGAP